MGLAALPAMDPVPHSRPARIAVEWASGRIDFIEVEGRIRVSDAHLIELRSLTRDLSGCSSSVKRAWLEDREGRLLYSAVDGVSQPRKGPLPMA